MVYASSNSDFSNAGLLPVHDQEALVALWKSLAMEIHGRLSGSQNPQNAKLFDVEEPLPQELSISAYDGVLSIWLDVYTGHGSWNCISKTLDMAEPWILTSSGQFHLDGEILEMSTAAERFIAKLSGQWTKSKMA